MLRAVRFLSDLKVDICLCVPAARLSFLATLVLVQRKAHRLTEISYDVESQGDAGFQGSPSPAPDVKDTNAWGVCKLTQNTNSAQVDFLPASDLWARTELR